MLLEYKQEGGRWKMADTQEKMVTKLGPEGQVNDRHTKWGGGEACQTERRAYGKAQSKERAWLPQRIGSVPFY